MLLGRFQFTFVFAVALLLAGAVVRAEGPLPADDMKLAGVKGRNSASLSRQLAARGLRLGNPVYLRVFKTGEVAGGLVSWQTGWEMHYLESVLEAWVQGDDGLYHLFKTYVICGRSGELGPKRKEGDLQTPEGFYALVQFRTDSNFHLSMQVSYPNGYDRAHGATGKDIYVHGNCQSIGCMAMTDRQIEEIYLLTWEANQNGQLTTPIDIFPFRLSDENMEAYVNDRNIEFWKELKPGFDHFEKHRRPPYITTKNDRYAVVPNL